MAGEVTQRLVRNRKRRIRGKRRLSVRLDMTPMVDIAFLLLIFYMVSTQFKPPEAEAVELPQSHSMIELPARDVINLTISADGAIFIDFLIDRSRLVNGVEVIAPERIIRPSSSSSVAHEINRVRVAMKANKRNPMIVFKADRRARFGVIQEVMKSMQENHLGQFLITTELESDL